MNRKRNRFSSFQLFLVFAVTLPLSHAWVKIDSQGGIEVFKEGVEGSPIIAFRGETIIDAPISKVASIPIDTSRYMEWVDKIKEMRLLSSPSSRNFTAYLEIGTPPLVTHRDFVIDYKTEIKSDGIFVMHMKSGDDSLMPNTGLVRAKLLNGSYTVTPLSKSKCRIVAEIHTDPKGWLPKWTVNLFQKDWPYKTLTALKRVTAVQVEENDDLVRDLQKG